MQPRKLGNTMLFNELGRKIPTPECRVFDNAKRNFYKINKPSFDVEKQHIKALELKLLDESITFNSVNAEQKALYTSINNNPDYQNLLLGTCVPFAVSIHDLKSDIGEQLEEDFLPLVKKTYEESQNGSWFKATLQGGNALRNSLNVVEASGYKSFLDAVKSHCVVGYYFPTAFQEYDIASQRNQVNLLPKNEDFSMCLSGHVEASYSLVMYPDLLFDRKNYSPILCLSALEHTDQRMVPMFKSYGPHLEFWLLSQMMTETQTQISEQWSGGLTIYKCL